MTDPISGSMSRRWPHRAIAAGTAALFAAGATAGPALGATAAAPPTAPTVSLVAPTGPYQTGTVRLHLVDPTRIDPTSPTGGPREVEVQMWYPAADTRGFPSTPYMPSLAAAHFLATNDALPGAELPQTTGHPGAPVDRRNGPYPVVLYSPGGEADGALDTGLVEDLVSHGYVVVTMDDTNESPEVEFPGGRLVVGTFVPETDAQSLEAQQIRAADASFVLDELTVLDHGGDPDTGHAPLPAGLAGSLDLSQAGMFGWSLGGAASAQAMHDDPRIKAAVNLDGRFWGPLAQQGVNRPFLLLTAADNTAQNDPTIASFLDASTGPKLHLNLADAEHQTFTDAEELVPLFGLTPDEITQFLGTIGPKTAVTDERAYIDAFFDTYLRHHDDHLLDGPSPRFPDVQFES